MSDSHEHVKRGAKWNAKWAFRPDSINELSRGSQVIMTGEVSDIWVGEPLATPGTPDVEPIPTQVITMHTASTLKGKIPSEIRFTKTGTQDNWIEDDPPFKVGSKYMMFLDRRDKGLYVPVGPDGRIELTLSGKLGLGSSGSIAAEIDAINRNMPRPALSLTDKVKELREESS
jgi:hypothetical protein